MSSSCRPNMVVGSYVLEELLGAGGMAEVWKARHAKLGSPVAIKFLLRELGHDRVLHKRFENEARLTARLKTSFAVKVFDFGVTEHGRPFLVMELLHGETLGALLEREPELGPATVVEVVRQVAYALDGAHAMGIVHRDLKPDNIFLSLGDDGATHVKVVDFGIARIIGDLEVGHEVTARTAGDASLLSTLIRTADLVGTPLYMSPEQTRPGLEVGGGADIWALGVVTFECLTGRRPFEGADLPTVLDRVQRGVHLQATTLVPHLPLAFDVWFRVACARVPSERFTSAGAAAEELAAALGVAAPPAPRAPSPSFPDIEIPTSQGGKRIPIPMAPRTVIHAGSTLQAPHPHPKFVPQRSIALEPPAAPLPNERPGFRRPWIVVLLAALLAVAIGLAVKLVAD